MVDMTNKGRCVDGGEHFYNWTGKTNHDSFQIQCTRGCDVIYWTKRIDMDTEGKMITHSSAYIRTKTLIPSPDEFRAIDKAAQSISSP